MYSELDFVLLAESIRDVHLQGLIREVYGVSVNCLKERRVPLTDGITPSCHKNASTKGRGSTQDNYDNARYQVGDRRRNDSKKYDKKRNIINTFLGGTLFKMSVVSHIPSCNIFSRIKEREVCLKGERTLREIRADRMCQTSKSPVTD